MKRILFLLLVLVNGPLMAQVDSAAMMKSWIDYGTPGDMHRMLAKFDGTWDTDITMWSAPDTPPERTTGIVVNRMIMGGRFQETTNTANIMGIPFEGIAVTGYDNAKKLFVSTWIDNMGTGILFMEGPWDAATKTIDFKGKTIDPLTMKESHMREVFRIIDDDTQQMEIYGPDLLTGKEYKAMEVRYTRRK